MINHSRSNASLIDWLDNWLISVSVYEDTEDPSDFYLAYFNAVILINWIVNNFPLTFNNIKMIILEFQGLGLLT